MSEYAMSVSYSMVDNGEEVEAGFHAKSTDGLDIDILVNGDDREEVVKAVASEAMETALEQLLAQSLSASENEETTRDEPISLDALQLENEQLRDEVSYLRKLLGPTETNSCTSFEDLFDNDDSWTTTYTYKDNKGNQQTTHSKEDIFACFDDFDIDNDALQLFVKMFGLV